MEMIMLTKKAAETPDRSVFYVMFIFVGIFSVVAAICNWDWYFNGRRARTMCKMFGRTATRVIQVILGLVIISMSVYALISPNVQ